MGVWHQLPAQICYRHSLPWRQQSLSGWQPLPQTRGEYFWNHPNSTGRTSCYKHTDTCMAGKILFSFLPPTHKKKINKGVFSPFIHFSWFSHFLGEPWLLKADRNFVFPFQLCHQHSRDLRRSLKLPVAPRFSGSRVRLCHLHMTWEVNYAWEGIFGYRRCLEWRCKGFSFIPRNYKRSKSFFFFFWGCWICCCVTWGVRDVWVVTWFF